MVNDAAPLKRLSGNSRAVAFPRTITTAELPTNRSRSVAAIYTGPSISGPMCITAGPDGALWFINWGADSIGRITTAGVTTNYSQGINCPAEAHWAEPADIAAGPDGALWYTDRGADSIGRITTAGVVTIYTGTGISSPEGIVVGPDGALWFTNTDNNSIGRIATGGEVTDYP